MDKNNANNLSEYFSDEEYIEIVREFSEEEYIETARELTFDEVYDAYEGEEITEFSEDVIFHSEIRAVDSCGKKIIMIPYQVNNHMVYGLILIMPVIYMGAVILDALEPKHTEDYSKIPSLIEEFKSLVEWNE